MSLGSITIIGIFTAIAGLIVLGFGAFLIATTGFSGTNANTGPAGILQQLPTFIGTFIALCALGVSVWSMAIGRDSAERQTRAYVGFQGGAIVLVNNGSALRVEGRLKNYGKSPADEFTTWIKVLVLPKDDTSVFKPRNPDLPKGSSSILYPDDSVNIDATFDIPPGELAAVRSGEMKVFVWGGADYKDAFGNLRYSRFYDVNAQEAPVNSGKWSLQPASRGYERN